MNILAATMAIASLAAIAAAGARLATRTWGAPVGGFVPLCGAILGSVLVGELLATVNAFNEEGLAVIGVVSLVVVTAVRTPAVPARIRGSNPALISVVGVAIVIASAAVVNGPGLEFDTIRYHIVNASSLLRHGSLWILPYAEPGEHTATAPAGAEALSALLMIGEPDDRLAYLPNVGWSLLLGWAAVIAAVRCGAGRRVAIALLLALFASPVIMDRVLHTMMTDVMVAASVVTCVVLWMEICADGWSARRVFFIGLVAGLACAGKYSGLFFFVVLVGVFTWDAGAHGHRRHTSTLLVAGAAITSGIWYVRNWVVSGNPLWPMEVKVGGHVIFGAPSAQYTLSPEAVGPWLVRSFQNWETFGMALLISFGLLLPVVAGLVRGALIGPRRLLIITGSACVIVYLSTPYSVDGGDLKGIGLQFRFLLPALVLLIAASCARTGERTALVILGVSLARSTVWAFEGPTGPDRLILSPTSDVQPLGIALLVGGLILMLIVVGERCSHTRRLTRPLVLVGAPLAFALMWPGVPRTHLIDAVDNRMGRGPVVVVMAWEMRELLGAHLDVPVVSAGTGPQGAQGALQGAALTEEILRLMPSLVVVGRDAVDVALPAWSPPAQWQFVTAEADVTIYRVPTDGS